MQTMPRDVMERVESLPERAVEPGEVVVHAGGATGQLMFLKRGTLDIEIEDEHLMRVSEPGAVVGDIAVLLDRPHTATVRAAAPSALYVVDDPIRFLRNEPELLLYVARVLAERLNAVNHLLIDSRKRISEGGEKSGLLADVLGRVSQALNIRTIR